jgi:hypothetical protein
MALPEYFARNAVAAAQAISGLDEPLLASALQHTVVGISVGQGSADRESDSAAELFVRLAARLYPRIAIRAAARDGRVERLEELAAKINPRVELGGRPTIEVILGEQRAKASQAKRIYVGSSGWRAAISPTRTISCGKTNNPFGAGLAACLAAGNVFRLALTPDGDQDAEAILSALPPNEVLEESLQGDLGQLVLVGGGAIGNGAAWALSKIEMRGALSIVDHESVDLGNLQRYVLAERTHEGAEKAALLKQYFTGALQATEFTTDLAGFLVQTGYAHDKMLLALDSAAARRAAQASLPRWIANAWTQPGDLGVSIHPYFGKGACVSCLYLPEQAQRNEDELIAQAFGVPEQILLVRGLLYSGSGAPSELLQAIAQARGVELEKLLPFEGRPLRALYTEGFCGGAVISLRNIGKPRSEVHVPLAHQSALAGVLLAAAGVRKALGGATESTSTQLDVLKQVPPMPTRPLGKEPTGRCICHDLDFMRSFSGKYGLRQLVDGQAFAQRDDLTSCLKQ